MPKNKHQLYAFCAEQRLLNLALNSRPSEAPREIPPGFGEALSDEEGKIRLRGETESDKKDNIENALSLNERPESIQSPADFYASSLKAISSMLEKQRIDDPKDEQSSRDKEIIDDAIRDATLELPTKQRNQSEKFAKQDFIENNEVNELRQAQGGIEVGGIEKMRFIFINENTLVTDAESFKKNIALNNNDQYDLSNVYLRTVDGRVSIDGSTVKIGSSIAIISVPPGTRLFKKYAKLASDPFKENEKMYRLFGNSGADVVTTQTNTKNRIRGTITRAQTLGDSALQQKGGEAISNMEGELAGIQSSSLAGGSGVDGTANFIPATEIRRELLANGINPDFVGTTLR